MQSKEHMNSPAGKENSPAGAVSEETGQKEIIEDYVKSIIENSPFAGEDYSENNYVPTEW